MLINPFQPEWQSHLNRLHASLPHGASLILLIDGAFVPKIFRQLSSVCKPILLFELLPGCSKEAKDISPFVVSFDPADRSLWRVLMRCNGWPMLSVMATYENSEHLARRLAAWCIVEVGGQSFNFRFPDTRRLPTVFKTLTKQQRGEFIGNAIAWHYVNRDGIWCSLSCEPSTILPLTPEKAKLNEGQFAQLLEDSEPDEMWVQLLNRGARTHLLPSQRYALLSKALYVANLNGLNEILRIDWCMDCIRSSCLSDSDTLQAVLKKWKEKNARGEDEALCQTA